MRRLSFLAAFVLTIPACLGGDFADSVEGNWVLDSGSSDGEPILILDSNPITMRLDGGQIGGTAACNSYGGRYRLASNGNFRLVDGVSVTEMACSPAEVMESERQFLEALIRVDRIAIADTTLTLTGNGQILTFLVDVDAPSPNTPAPGADNPDQPVSSMTWFGPETFGTWVLDSGTVDGRVIPMVGSHPITLEISELGFGGRVCNHYGFALPLPDDGSFPNIVSTMMLCMPEAVMESEAAYFEALGRFRSAGVVDGRLVIEGDGVELSYRPGE
jgi:heat shock protein HslJ